MMKSLNLLEIYCAGGCSVFAIENFLAGNWLIATLESLIVVLVGINTALSIKKGDL